jgi:hypothetical protein
VRVLGRSAFAAGFLEGADGFAEFVEFAAEGVDVAVRAAGFGWRLAEPFGGAGDLFGEIEETGFAEVVDGLLGVVEAVFEVLGLRGVAAGEGLHFFLSGGLMFFDGGFEVLLGLGAEVVGFVEFAVGFEGGGLFHDGLGFLLHFFAEGLLFEFEAFAECGVVRAWGGAIGGRCGRFGVLGVGGDAGGGGAEEREEETIHEVRILRLGGSGFGTDAVEVGGGADVETAVGEGDGGADVFLFGAFAHGAGEDDLGLVGGVHDGEVGAHVLEVEVACAGDW